MGCSRSGYGRVGWGDMGKVGWGLSRVDRVWWGLE